MTIKQLQEWVEKAVKGNNICYYTGYLAKDIGGLSGYDLRKVANFMVELSDQKKVSLVQKKISGIRNVVGTDTKIKDNSPIIYKYIAQKR